MITWVENNPIIALGIALFLVFAFLFYMLLRRIHRKPKKRNSFQPYVSPRSSSVGMEYLNSRYDDLRVKNTRVEDVIQTYSRNGSIPKTAASTGYSKWKVKRILIKAGKYTTKREAKRIFNKYR